MYQVPLLDVSYKLLWLTKRQWVYAGIAFELFMAITKRTAFTPLQDVLVLLACGLVAVLGCVVEWRGRGIEHWVMRVCSYRAAPKFVVWRPTHETT